MGLRLLPTIEATTKNWTSAAASRPRPDRVDRLAWWLDDVITIPGTRFRVGLDAVIGLIPGIGDLIGTLLSSYIVAVAAGRGLPLSALARMVINVGVDAVVGAVPVVGDLFDAAWKANRRNLRLLEQYERAPQATRRQSLALVVVVIVAVIAMLAAVAWLTFAVLRWLVAELGAAA